MEPPADSAVRPRDELYRHLCYLLSERADQVDWAAFSPADWDSFVNLARAEGAAPLAYWHFKGAGLPHVVPEGIREELAEAYRRTGVRNMILFRELDRILGALSEAGIPVVVLKGAALARTVYPDMALRPMADLDVLVPVEKVEEAVNAVESLGYRKMVPRITRWFSEPGGRHVCLLSPPDLPTGVRLELHWNFIADQVDRRSPPLDWFWSQTQPFFAAPGRPGIGAHKGLQLAPAAHLLYLAAHLALQHGLAQGRLLWLYDIWSLVSREADRLDWNQVVVRAREFRWSAAAHLVLSCVRERLGLPSPDGLLRSLLEESDPGMGRLARRKALHEQTSILRSWSRLATMPWPARLRMVFSLLFPSPGFLRQRYQPRPTWIWPLYYLYRWLHVLCEPISQSSR